MSDKLSKIKEHIGYAEHECEQANPDIELIKIYLKGISAELRLKFDYQENVSQRSELVCHAGYYPNSTSTGMECIHCGRGKYAH